MTIDHTRKSTIVDHLEGKKHKDREDTAIREASENEAGTWTASAAKRQVTLSSAFENVSKKARGEVVEDLVYALTASDIPLHKVDKPAFRTFLEKHVTNANAIPSGDYLRRTNNPRCIR